MSHINESCPIWMSLIYHSYGTWLIHMGHHSFIWDMTHSYVTWLIRMRHDSFTRDMTHSYETWLVHMWHASFTCDMTHSYVTCFLHIWHASFTCDIPHSHMGWLRLVGCLKVYVSLQNIGLFCRSLLQKRPIFLSILLIVATPYETPHSYVTCGMSQHIWHSSLTSVCSYETQGTYPHMWHHTYMLHSSFMYDIPQNVTSCGQL